MGSSEPSLSPIKERQKSDRMGSLHITIEKQRWQVALDSPIDLAIPLDFAGPQPNAFGLPKAEAVPFEAGDFVGDRSRGGPVNCFTISTNPHGNGTHTETARHIHSDAPTLASLRIPAFVPAWVATVPLEAREETLERYPIPTTKSDRVVTRKSLEKATKDVPKGFLEGLVIRTLPNPEKKRHQQHSGHHPGYLTIDAIEWIVTQEIQHLLVDLPSVDREDDQGQLAVHHLYWEQAWQRTITEMIYVPNNAPDGPYFLNLQVPRFVQDAAPSRPLLFTAKHAE